MYQFGKTDRFPNTFYFSGTLLPSCVKGLHNSYVTGCLLYLKILHNKVLQDACYFYTLLHQVHYTVIPLTDNRLLHHVSVLRDCSRQCNGRLLFHAWQCLMALQWLEICKCTTMMGYFKPDNESYHNQCACQTSSWQELRGHLGQNTRWGITSVPFGLTYYFSNLHQIYENSVETLGPICRFSQEEQGIVNIEYYFYAVRLQNYV